MYVYMILFLFFFGRKKKNLKNSVYLLVLNDNIYIHMTLYGFHNSLGCSHVCTRTSMYCMYIQLNAHYEKENNWGTNFRLPCPMQKKKNQQEYIVAAHRILSIVPKLGW